MALIVGDAQCINKRRQHWPGADRWSFCHEPSRPEPTLKAVFLKATSASTVSLSRVVAKAIDDSWRNHPLLCLLFALGVLASIVFWTQLGDLAWFGQLLLLVVVVVVSYGAGSVLTRAWMSFQLKESLLNLGSQDAAPDYLAGKDFFETLAVLRPTLDDLNTVEVA